MTVITNKKVFFPNLDGLRFVGFIMVFLCHVLKPPFDLLEVESVFLRQSFYFFFNGKTGVSIFFVLSGFLITYLILAEAASNKKFDLLKFYMRRSLRIWPLYFLLLVIIFVGVPFIAGSSGFDWDKFDMNPLYYFLFVGNFDVLNIYLRNGTDFLPSTVTWSVAIEEQFYLVWPLLFLVVPYRFIRFIFPVCLLGSYLFRFTQGGSSPVLTFHTIGVVGDLALGGWAAYLSLTDRKFVQFFNNQSNRKRFLIYSCSLLTLFLIQVLQTNLTEVFGRLPQTLFFAYVILDQNFSRQTSFKFFNSKFMSFWGKYTYGLYLWHPLIMLAVSHLVTRFVGLPYENVFTHLLIAFLALLLSFVVSYFSYHCYEIYFLNLKKRFATVRSRRRWGNFHMLKQ